MSILKSGNHHHHRIVTQPNDNIHDNGSRDQSFIEFHRIYFTVVIIIITIIIVPPAPAEVLTNSWNAPPLPLVI